MANDTSAATPVQNTAEPLGFFADILTFDWKQLNFALPSVCTLAVAVCLFGGIAAGHPGAALLAGGGAYTIGFGVNQRTTDSRVLPMLLAVIAVAVAGFIGCSAGHRGFELLIAAAVAAFLYGCVFPRANGISWVSQQAAIALLVASAFPAGIRMAAERSAMITVGGLIQLLAITLALHLTPELKRDLLSLHRHGERLIAEVWHLPQQMQSFATAASNGYVVRIVLTVTVAAWAYLSSGVPSGYWIPMTALLVQKPKAIDTAKRATLRIAGTMTGAWLCTLLVAHLHPGYNMLAALSVSFAFMTFATNTVNYGLFSVFVTSYIVTLLSLHQIQSTVIAHRRATCTVAGALIAMVMHADDLFRGRQA